MKSWDIQNQEPEVRVHSVMFWWKPIHHMNNFELQFTNNYENFYLNHVHHIYCIVRIWFRHVGRDRLSRERL